MFLGRGSRTQQNVVAPSKDASLFAKHWKSIKNKLVDYKELPNKYLTLWDTVAAKQRTRGLSVGQKYVYNKQLKEIITGYNDSIILKNKINQYSPDWTNQAKASNLGADPITLTILGSVGLVALGYVVVQGMRLTKDYAIQADIINKVANKGPVVVREKVVVEGKVVEVDRIVNSGLTIEEAQALITNSKSSPTPPLPDTGIGSTLYWVMGITAVLSVGFFIVPKIKQGMRLIPE